MIKRNYIFFVFFTVLLFFTSVARASETIKRETVKGETVNQLNQYLSTLQSVKGEFVQIGPDGAVANGTFAIRKPGKMNFSYEPPTPIRILSDGFWVAVENKKLKTRDRYPLSKTPLSLLVKNNIRLEKSSYVKNIHETDHVVHVTAYNPEKKEQGNIKFIFTKEPFALREWVVTDAQGLKTTVTILNIIKDIKLDNELFYIAAD